MIFTPLFSFLLEPIDHQLADLFFVTFLHHFIITLLARAFIAALGIRQMVFRLVASSCFLL